MAEQYDLSIIGAGPGGYVAALYAAQRGLKVCLFEKGDIGGVCLNEGCIPTKTMHRSASVLEEVTRAAQYGIRTQDPVIDMELVKSRVDKTVTLLRSGVEQLLKARKVTVKKGVARIAGQGRIEFGGESILSSNIILASGASYAVINGLKPDGKTILTAKDMLGMTMVPKTMAVIGAGFIGCEFASIFSRFGSQVSLIDVCDRILPYADNEISKRLDAAFRKRGIKIVLQKKISGVSVSPQGADLELEGGETVQADIVLVSAGRVPAVKDLGLENTRAEFDFKGVKTGPDMMTSEPGLYAIGDCTGGYMLAHVASYQGLLAVDNILGHQKNSNYNAVPYCVFTDPEIASCGLTESDAAGRGIEFKTSKFYYRALGKSHVLGKTDGYIKLIYSPSDGKILGSDIMGERAGDLIGEICLAINTGRTVSELSATIHPHPTLTELIPEVAHVACGMPLHSL